MLAFEQEAVANDEFETDENALDYIIKIGYVWEVFGAERNQIGFINKLEVESANPNIWCQSTSPLWAPNREPGLDASFRGPRTLTTVNTLLYEIAMV